MSLLENVTLHMELDNSDFKREFKEATTVVDKQMNALTLGADAFAAKWEDITSNLRSFKRVASGLAISAGIYAVTGAITGASEAILTFRNNLEASEISMTYFAENALQAKEYIRELEDFAAYTPFSTESAISMAQYLQAMSVPINASKSMLKVISDTAAATGATEQNMQRIVTALGQILTKGKLAAEEVRQLANANIPIYDILKQQLNLTGQEIKNLGKLNINASKAVVAILDGLKDRYEGAAEQIAETLGGMTETIKDDALIISEAFFHGSLDRLEDRITGIRDKLDEWRDIALHQGTGGMITAIIGDLDPTGSGTLEQFIIAAIAGFKNLGDTIHDFATRNGTALKIFTSTAYTGLMSLTIAADYLLRVFNKVQAAGDALVSKVNQLTGMSLTLSDVVAGLMVFRTVGKTLYFAANTALWAGKQFVTLGTSITSIIPGIASASAMTQGLVAGLLTLGAAAATAYLGLKAIQGATGVSDSSKLVTDEYTKQMEEYNKALESQAESLNEDYSSIADNWAAGMSDALDTTEKKAKKTAKKIEKSWLMSFDEVFQIWEDPTSKLADDDLQLFEDIDWGSFFKLPIFRFPEELKDALEAPSYNIADAIDTAQGELSTLNKILPAVIMGTSLIGTILKNRRDALERSRNAAGEVADELLNEKEKAAKLDGLVKNTDDVNEAATKMAADLNKTSKTVDSINAERVKAAAELSSAQSAALKAQKAEFSKLVGAEKLTADAMHKVEQATERFTKLQETEIPSLSAKVAYTSANIKQLKDTAEKTYKFMSTTGSERVLNTTGIEAGTNAIVNAKLADAASAMTDRFVLLSHDTADILSLMSKTYEATSETELTDISSSLLSLTNKQNRDIEALTSNIQEYLRVYTRASNSGATNLNSQTMKELISGLYGTTDRQIEALAHVVRTTSSRDLVAALGGSVGDQLKNIRSSLTLLERASAVIGDVTSNAEIRELLEKQYAMLEPLTKPIKDAANKLVAMQVINDARSARGEASYRANTLNDLENDFKELLKPISEIQSIVKSSDQVALDIIKDMNTLNGLAREMTSLTHRILNAQYTSDVASIASATIKYLEGNTVFSTGNDIVTKYLGSRIDAIYDEVKLLKGTATADTSLEFLDTIRERLGYGTNAVDTAASDTAKSLPVLLNEYTDKINGIIADKADNILDRSKSIVNQLSTLGAVTEKEFNRATTLLDKIKKDADEAITYYPQQNLELKELERQLKLAAQYDAFTYAANKRITTQVSKELYTNIAKTIEDSSLQASDRIARRIDTLVQQSAKNNPRIWASGFAHNATEDIKKLYEVLSSNNTIPSTHFTTDAYNIPVQTDNREVVSLLDFITSDDYISRYEQIINDATDKLGNLHDLAIREQRIGMLEQALQQGNTVPFIHGTTEEIIDELKTTNALLAERDTYLKQVNELYTEIVNEAIKARDGYYNDDKIQYQRNITDKSGTKPITRADIEAWAKEDFDAYSARIFGALEEADEKALSTLEWFNNTYNAFQLYAKNLALTDYAGGYTAWDTSAKALADNVAARFLDIIANPQSIADAARKLLWTDSGTTKPGATYDSIIRYLTDKSYRVSDEEAVGILSEFNIQAGSMLNTMTSSLIAERGQLVAAATVSDATGTISGRLSGILALNGDVNNALGVIQSSVISAKDTALFKFAADNHDTIVELSSFLRATAAKAPDVAANVLGSFLAAPKLKGILLSITNAKVPIFSDGATIFDRLLKDAYNSTGRLSTLPTYDQIRELQHILQDTARRNQIPADTLRNANRQVTIVLGRDGQAILDNFRTEFAEKASTIVDSLDIIKAAAKEGRTLNTNTFTNTGIEFETSARYLTRDELKRALDMQILATVDNYNALTGLADSAKNLETYFRALLVESTTNGAAVQGNISIINDILDQINTTGKLSLKFMLEKNGINSGYVVDIPSFNGVAGQQLKQAIIDAANETIERTNAYVNASQFSYNDVMSQLSSDIKQMWRRTSGQGTWGTSSDGIWTTLHADNSNSLRMLEKLATYVEGARGYAPESSAAINEALHGNTPSAAVHLLELIAHNTDPLMFETGEQANKRLLLDYLAGRQSTADIPQALIDRYANVSNPELHYNADAINKTIIPTFEDVIKETADNTTATKANVDATDELIDKVDEFLRNRATNANNYIPSSDAAYNAATKRIQDAINNFEKAPELNDIIDEDFVKEWFDDLTTEGAKNARGFTYTGNARGTAARNAYRNGTADFASEVVGPEVFYNNGARLTNSPWYNAIIDDDVRRIIMDSLTDEQSKAFSAFGAPIYSDYASFDFLYGQGIEGHGLKETEKIIEDAAKEAFGDTFDDWDRIVRAADYVSGGGGAPPSGTHGLGTLSDAFNNPMFQRVMNPNEVGISGLDWAFALKHSIDALSGGMDEFDQATARWNKITGYEITPLSASGKAVDNGNLINIGQAAIPGVQSLALEGSLTSIISGAAATAITSALGLTGAGAAAAGAAVTLPVALLVSALMAATGAFNQANIASENWKEMLDDTTWASEQAKAQGASDKEAKQAQLGVARDIYTNYYNNMSSIWSMYDKAAIRDLNKYSDNNFTGEKDRTSYRFAVEEILGRPDIYGLQKSTTDTGWLNYGEGRVASELNADKMEQQLYTLYTTGGMDKILNKKGGYTDLEEDWLYRLDYLGEYQVAQLNDYYREYVNAIQYINEHTKEEIIGLLQGYNLPANTMQDMIEGIAAIYRAGIEQMNQLIDIKGQYINLGSISTVGLDELATGTGSVMRAMEGDLTGIEQKYLDMLSDATGVYVSAMSDTMYTLAYDIEAVRDKMTGFTVTFPDTIKVGTDTISVKDIASNTKSVEILHGMGIHINNDGTITVSTEAVNANESGHDRRMAVSYSDISAYELAALSNAGIDLSNSRNDKTRISLDEAAMQNSIKGMTYNLTGVDLQAVSEATVTALKAKGILLSQNQETGATYATITDTGFVTGASDIASLISSLDPDTVARMSENLKGALRGIDAINAFGSKHGESRMGSAAGIEIDTGLLGSEYSAALEQAFSEAGVKLQRTVDAAGNEHVYAAINNVGEQWHKAITQWRSSDITPELEKFLQSLGVEVVKYGDYTMVSTEDVIKNLSKSSSSGLRNILFDNAELWKQFPEETRNAFIAAGLATEDGFIKLDAEAIDGWHRFELDGQTHIAKAFEAMEQGIVDHFIKMQGTTVVSWSALTEEQRLALEKLGITTEQQYNTNSDELLQLITGNNAVVKDNVVQGWNTLSAEQKALLAQIGIENEEQYAAHFQELYTIGNTGFGIINEDTILGWDELSGTTKAKLSEMGITTEAQYNKYLGDMNVATGQGLSTVDATTAESLLKIGATTSAGWGDIKQVTDTTLSETEKLALGYMKFEDLPETVRNALSMEAGVGKDLHDSWWAINADADEQLNVFSNTVDGMAADLNRVKDLAAQLKQALADPGLQAETLMANLAAGSATALEAAKSGSNKWAKMGGTSHGDAPGGWGGAWENWNNNIQITSSKVGISEVHADSAGNPMVYYIYNLNINGTPGQIIKNADGVWHKYYGTQEYNENNLPGFKLGGMVTGDGLFRAGEFGLNEAIVPLEQPQAMHKIGNALAAALPTWELVAPLQQAIGMRDGGVASFDSFRSVQKEQSVEDIVTRIMDAQSHKAPVGNSHATEDLRPLYVGTLIADKAGLRELDRQMKRVVRQDGGM